FLGLGIGLIFSNNGTIGFNGDSTFLTSEDRLYYLEKYAEYAKIFFQNTELNNQPVEEPEVVSLLEKIKPMPSPKNRQRLVLDEWKWKTYQVGQSKREQEQIEGWTQTPNVAVENGVLKTTNNFTYAKDLEEPQDWRFVFQWETRIPKTSERSAFLLLDESSSPVILLGVTAEGGCFYKSRVGIPIGIANFNSDTLLNFKVLVDVEAGRFSLYLNDELKADFVKTLSENPVHKFFINLPKNASLDNVYGISYARPAIDAANNLFPLPSGNVFMDERFEVSEEFGDLSLANFNDENWEPLKLPTQSGDRFRDSDLILRKPLLIGSFERANLHFEHIAKETEVWLNNEVIYIHRGGQQLDLDITDYLLSNQPNQLMLRLRGGKGWQLNNVWLDLTSPVYVKEAFVYTESLTDTAVLRVQAKLRADQIANTVNGRWQGRVNVKITPWSPRTQNDPVINQTFPITLRAYKTEDFSENILLLNPKVWSPENPNLYKVELSLLDSKGQYVDAYVFTTGVRTVSQENGVFHLNGRPTPLFGANLTDYLPFDVDAYSVPTVDMDKWIVRAVASIKEMNGNVVRSPELKDINLERLASICDQMGLMLIKQVEAPTQNEPWALDFEAARDQVIALRHHPSIILWQAPDNLRFNNYLQDASKWMERFFQNMRFYAPNTLVALHGANTEFGGSAIPNDEGNRLYESSLRRYRLLSNPSVWTSPQVIRNNADQAISSGKDWDDLREFPIDYAMDTLRLNYLKSKTHLYLDLNSENLAGQENPLTVRGTPYRYSESYQSPYPNRTVGAEIIFENWKSSQGLQGFSNYESLRKKRWLGYDGILAGTLWNGGDPTTLLDARGFAKLGYHTSQMAFQPALAGSRTTDLAYQVGEVVPIFLNYIGQAARFQVSLKVKNEDGKILESQVFPAVSFPAGNNTMQIGDWVSSLNSEGWFYVEYEVTKL
ncbi:MAG: hypothetical protein AAFP82_12125, partial [Bacteroidota bacterium]